MTDLITRRMVLRRFGVSGQVLDRLEELELLLPVRRPGRGKAYREEDLEHLRVWCLLVEELDVNPAGAEIVLQLRNRVLTLHRALWHLVEGLRDERVGREIRHLLESLLDDRPPRPPGRGA